MLVLSYGVQSYHCFLVMTFRVIFLSFGVQIHHLLIAQHLGPSSFLNFNVQSHPSKFELQGYQFSVWHLESPYLLSLVFRAMFSVWRLELHI